MNTKEAHQALLGGALVLDAVGNVWAMAADGDGLLCCSWVRGREEPTALEPEYEPYENIGKATADWRLTLRAKRAL